MSETKGEMHFDDQAPVEIPFTVGSRHFLIREGDTAVYRKYRDGMNREISVDPETKKISAGAPTYAMLQALALSTFELKAGKDGQRLRVRVQMDTVLAWKPAVTKWAFAKLCEITPGLSVEDDATKKDRETRLKNSPSGGTPSSDTVESTDATCTS